jgi:hypothetical protein
MSKCQKKQGANMQLKSILVAATLLLSITSTQAALVESDWKNTGDTLATLDTETGIEWLDLTQTNGYTVAQIVSDLDSTYEGWRLPTQTEVYDLFSRYLPAPSALENGHITSNKSVVAAEVAEFHAFLGDSNFGVDPSDETRRTFGGYYLNNGTLSISGANLYSDDRVFFIGQYDSRTYNSIERGEGFFIKYFATYLVSDGGTTLSSQQDPSSNANNVAAPINNVSAPALLGLMGLGLFGFAARRRSLK